MLCISIAAKPGNFGTTFFNRAFAALGLDYVYKAMRLDPNGDLESVLKAIRALEIRGCGVSMPFKEKVLAYLDALDATAQKTKAVNTIVNTNGTLKGFNTDYAGATALLQRTFSLSGKEVLICGLGGVARAITFALLDLKAKVSVTGRDPEKLRHFVADVPAVTYPWKNLEQAHGFLLVNATSVGMSPETNQAVVSQEVVKKFEAVFDVVSDPKETLLVQMARQLNQQVVTGRELVLEQALLQFKLYTGREVSRDEAQSFSD